MAPRSLIKPALTRYQAYEPWRAAAEAVLIIRAMIRGDVVQGDPREPLSRLALQLPLVVRHFPDEPRANADTLIALLRVELPLDKTLLQAVWLVFEPLSRLLLNGDGLQPSFAADRPPALAIEENLLSHAFSLDSAQAMGSKVDVVELAEQARIDVSMTRRVLCSWIDDNVAYLPHDLVSADEPEHFVLSEGADTRRDNWRQYAQARNAARRMNVPIPYPEQLPHYWPDSAKGAAAHLGIDCEHVLLTKQGLIATIVLPEEWVGRDDPRIGEYVRDVQDMLAGQRVRAPVHAPVNATFYANQVAAQGPDAVATANTFGQNVARQDWRPELQAALAEELALLRAALALTAATSIEDGEALGYVALAEGAARRGDRIRMIGALMLIGPRLPELALRLGLRNLEHEARTQLSR